MSLRTSEPRNHAPRVRSVRQTFGSVTMFAYAVNEVPQPQLPVAFGFLKVKPEPITPVT